MIRRGRERLGLSQARVAELVGRSPATVRSWEKGSSVPAEASVVTSLAAVLDLDEGTLFGAAGLPPPVSERSLTLEESLALIAPAQREEAPPALPDIREVWQEAPAAAPTPPSVYEPPPPAPALEAAVAPPEAGSPAVPGRERGRRRAEQPRPATAAPPMARPPRVVLPSAPPARSYVEDPEQRLSYQLRGIYTLVGMALLLVVLVWALANAVDALGEAWDALTGSL